MDLWDDPNLTFSKIAISWLLEKDSRICTTEFNTSLIQAVKEDGEELSFLLKGNRIIPDAYVIDQKDKTVFLFEIEDTHLITPDKLRKLSEIWFRLDSIGWEMRLFLIDRYMHNWTILPLSRIWHTLERPGKYRRTPREIQNQQTTQNWESVYQKIKSGHILDRDEWI